MYIKNEYVQSQLNNTGTQHAQTYIRPYNTSKLQPDTKNGMKILEWEINLKVSRISAVTLLPAEC